MLLLGLPTHLFAAIGVGSVPTSSGGGGATLVAIRNMQNFDSGATPTGFYQTIEQCFASGAVSSSQIAEPRKGDGVTVMTNWQADNRINWGNGSLRCARFTFKYPSQLAASGTDTLKFYSKSGSWNNSAWTNPVTYIPANSDFRMEVVISGTTYTCGVNNLITAGTYYQYSLGPSAVGMVMYGPYRNGTGGGATDQGSLQCRIYVTVYADGTFKVVAYTDACRYSNYATCMGSSISVTSTALKNYSLGTPTVWSSGAFTFTGGARFAAFDTDGQPYFSGTDVRKVVDAFPTPVLANSYTTNLWDARLTPFFFATPTQIASMSNIYNSITYAPEGLGDFSGISLDAPGGNWWLGYLPAVSVIAMWKGDWVSLRQDAIDALYLEAFARHFRNQANGNLVNLNGHTAYTGMTQDATMSGYGLSQSWNGDTSHFPSLAYYQWIYSGEEWWLDEYEELTWGMNFEEQAGSVNPYSRDPIINSTTFYDSGGAYKIIGTDGERSIAWWTRDLDNNAWIVHPTYADGTTNPNYQWCQDLMTNYWLALQSYSLGTDSNYGSFVSGSDPTVLGIVAFNYFNVSYGLQALFAADYMGIVSSMAGLRGQVAPTNKMIANHLTKFIIGRSVNGCAYAAAPEQANVTSNNAPGAITAWATSWSQVNVGGYNGSDSSISFGGPVTNVAGGGCPGSGLYTNGGDSFESWGVNNYAGYHYAAAVMAEQASITGAATDRAYYDPSLYISGGLANDTQVPSYPQWAIIPPQ